MEDSKKVFLEISAPSRVVILSEIRRCIITPLLARHLSAPASRVASLMSYLWKGYLSHELTIETVYGVIVAVYNATFLVRIRGVTRFRRRESVSPSGGARPAVSP